MMVRLIPDDLTHKARKIVSQIRAEGWEGAGVVVGLAEAMLDERERDLWQPIETAPKDGRTILAYNPVFGVYSTGYQALEPNEGDRWPCGFAGWVGVWYIWPTHWMPLPQPPKQPTP